MKKIVEANVTKRVRIDSIIELNFLIVKHKGNVPKKLFNNIKAFIKFLIRN